MADDGEDWLRRFTDQELEDDYSPPRPAASLVDSSPDNNDDLTSIDVRVDEQGSVSDVVIGQRWREVVQPHDLGRVLREAANTAIANCIATQAEQPGRQSVPDGASFECRDVPSGGGDPASPVTQSFVREALDLLARYNGELDTYAAQVRHAVAATSHGDGGLGRIAVTVTAGQVSDVSVDAGWAAGARPTEIRVEAISGFQAAEQQATSLGAGSIPLPPSMARLRELGSDPEALSRRLGLSR